MIRSEQSGPSQSGIEYSANRGASKGQRCTKIITHKPTRDMAYLMPAGLGSGNSAMCRSIRRSSKPRAVAKSPVRATLIILAQSVGATFAVIEITAVSPMGQIAQAGTVVTEEA